MSKKDLQKLISSLREKKFAEGQGKQISESVQKDLVEKFGPAIQESLKGYGDASNKAIAEALSKIQIPQAQIPEYPQPIVNVPEAPTPIIRPVVNVPAPIVNVPAPIVNIPQQIFPDRFNVDLDKINPKTPLPVMLFDIKGLPMQFPMGGGGSGKTDYFTIKDIRASSVSIIDQDTGAIKVVGNFSASGAGATTVSLVNVDGTYYNSDNPLPVTGTVSITDIFGSIGANVVNPDGRIKVELPNGATGLTDTELRATAVPVQQVSGAGWSTNVTDAFGSTTVSGVFNADNRIRVSVETGGSGLTDTELRASPVQTQQVSGYIDSVYVTGVATSIYAEMMNPDGRVKVELPTGSSSLTDTELRASAVPVEQVSGSAWTTFVKEIFGSTATDVVNPDGRLKVELPTGSSGLTDTELRASAIFVEQVSGAAWSVVTSVTGITNSIAVVNLDRDGNPQGSWLVSDVTASIKASLVDSTGVQYSGSNPVPMTLAVSNATSTINATLVDSTGAYRGTLPVAVVAGSAAIGSVTVNGSLNSVIAVGATLHGVADPGAAPQKVGGVVMTANPTAESGGDVSNFRTDDIGRQLVRNIQVRDLIRTAYVSVTNGTETTLRAAVAGAFLDLIMIVASNNSDAAVSVDIRAVTAGNVQNTLRIPANGTAGWTPPVPWPQDATGNNWTVDGPDETGRTLTFSALFSQEI